MPTAIRTPRVNNNDDVVKLSHLYVERGARIRSGDPLAEVETEKATFTVESEHEGYVLAVNGTLGDMVAVGSVLVWLGATPEERVEEAGGTPRQSNSTSSNEPTLKALLLLKHYQLDVADVAPSNGKLTADDVLRHVAARRGPELPGREEPLTPEQRGMLRTVSWQREHAVPGYLELEYNTTAWAEYAAAFKEANGLWYDPALSLMGWRLAQLAATKHSRINATVTGASAYLYEDVNLGFTVQADTTLYLVVVKAAQKLDPVEFARELGGLQLAAARHSLTAEQTSGATVSFSSMARWNVSRHMPVLPPQTSLIVAHTAGRLGATYDHRLLTGSDVARVLQALAKPPAQK